MLEPLKYEIGELKNLLIIQVWTTHITGKLVQ